MDHLGALLQELSVVLREHCHQRVWGLCSCDLTHQRPTASALQVVLLRRVAYSAVPEGMEVPRGFQGEMKW